MIKSQMQEELVACRSLPAGGGKPFSVLVWKVQESTNKNSHYISTIAGTYDKKASENGAIVREHYLNSY